MSSAMNHRARSRRGHYLGAPFTGGKRASRTSPTTSKGPFTHIIRAIGRNAKERLTRAGEPPVDAEFEVQG